MENTEEKEINLSLLRNRIFKKFEKYSISYPDLDPEQGIINLNQRVIFFKGYKILNNEGSTSVYKIHQGALKNTYIDITFNDFQLQVLLNMSDYKKNSHTYRLFNLCQK